MSFHWRSDEELFVRLEAAPWLEGALIGHQSRNLKHWEKLSHAQFAVAEGDDFLVISGERQCIRHGKELLLDELDRLTAEDGRQRAAVVLQENQKELVVPIPFAVCGLVVGFKGAGIKGARYRSGAYIELSEDFAGPDRLTKTLILRGSDQQIDAGLQEVEWLIQEKDRRIAYDNVEIHVPKDSLGKHVRRLRSETGAEITCERQSSGYDLVHLSGSADVISKACNLIVECASNASMDGSSSGGSAPGASSKRRR